VGRLPVWTSSFEPTSGQSRFRAGRLGQVWYEPAHRCWRWKAVGRSGRAGALSDALAAAQDAIITLLEAPPPELHAVPLQSLGRCPLDHRSGGLP
jgi:hypothetical protein